MTKLLPYTPRTRKKIGSEYVTREATPVFQRGVLKMKETEPNLPRSKPVVKKAKPVLREKKRAVKPFLKKMIARRKIWKSHKLRKLNKLHKQSLNQLKVQRFQAAKPPTTLIQAAPQVQDAFLSLSEAYKKVELVGLEKNLSKIQGKR